MKMGWGINRGEGHSWEGYRQPGEKSKTINKKKPSGVDPKERSDIGESTGWNIWVPFSANVNSNFVLTSKGFKT